MKRKIKLILNPMADMGNAWRAASDLRPIIEEYGGADWSGTVYPTHASEMAFQAGEEGYERVIAIGGDGTIHEVINGLMKLPPERRPILGVVPLGSGNDFARAAGIPPHPPEALRRALIGDPRPVDLGRVQDDLGRLEYFDNTLGIGFDGVVNLRSHRLPLLRGFLMYFIAVIQTILLNFEPMNLEIETDQERIQTSALMLTLCNGPREGGGFHVAPEARIDDGILNYVLVSKVSRPMMFRLIPEFLNGTQARFPQVRLGAFRHLRLTSDRPLYIHADGEVFSGFGTRLHHLEVECLPGAIRVAG